MAATVPISSPSTEVRKHVSAIHVSGELSLLERKLVNVLLLNAYDALLTQRKHRIPVGILSQMLGREGSNNGENLKKALTNIMKTVIEFDLLHKDPKKAKWAAATPIAFAAIESGVCIYEYSESLSERLANPDIYALININVQSQFNGSYALALYENCVRYLNAKSTGFISVEMWRRLLGADSDLYNEFKRFSDKVLRVAIREVNQVSNITITPEYKREARKVIAIKFHVEAKRQSSVMDVALPCADEIRKTESFVRLTALGIGPDLAIQWIQESPDRALQAAIQTEEKAQQNLIKTSSAGYARTLFESGADLTVKVSKQKKIKAKSFGEAAGQDVDEAQMRTRETDAAIAAMTDNERAALIAEFIAVHGATTYDPGQRKFRDTNELINYRTFTRRRAPEIIAARTEEVR